MKIVVFDTETIGKVGQDLINIGYHIVDLNVATGQFTVKVARDMIISEMYNNTIYCLNDDFVGQDKYNAFTNAINEGTAQKHTLAKAFAIMENDFKRQDPKLFFAYNCDFDTARFKESAERYGLKNPLGDRTVYDIWDFAYEFIISTKEYKDWCLATGQVTDSKVYIKGSVEGVSRYLYNDVDFVEKHTALSDTTHELNILVECVKRGADITEKPKRHKKVKSDMVMTETYVIDGQDVVVSYKSKYTKGGKTYFKK